VHIISISFRYYSWVIFVRFSWGMFHRIVKCFFIFHQFSYSFVLTKALFNILLILTSIRAFSTLMYDFFIYLQLCGWVTNVSTGRHVHLLTSTLPVYKSTTTPSVNANQVTIQWRFRDPRRRCSVLQVQTMYTYFDG
jgi:hypothetical protein